MAKIDLKNFTPDNGAIRSLSELIFLSVIMAGSLDKITTVIGGAKHGKKIGGVGEIGIVGVASEGCDPTFEKLNLKGIEKTWDLAEWQIPLEFCYKEIVGKLEGLSLKTGIAIEDMTSDEYMTDIVEPLVRQAVEKMLFRMAWFNDKTANNVADGGVITAGVATKYFTLNDGLFKRVFAAIAENPGHRVTIAANAKTTTAEQFDGLYVKGVATGIFDELKRKADSRVWTKPRVAVLATKSLVDALEWDLKESNKGGDLAYTDLFEGVQMTKYRGMDIISLPLWDAMIAEYENKGTSLNKPHRAVLASATDLLVGTGSKNSLDEFRIGFDEKNGVNWLRAKDTFGTQTVEDELITAAY